MVRLQREKWYPKLCSELYRWRLLQYLAQWLMQENPEEPKKIAHGIQRMIIKLTDFFDLDETNNIDNL